MIEITPNEINTTALLESVSSPTCGAAVLFVGTTRQFTGERETEKLAYECYQPMAIQKLNDLRDAAMKKWEIEKCAIVHRIGVV